MIKISIIIPTWNTAKITLKNVLTIIKYLPKDYAQIIIVDNNSTDNTQQLFSRLKDVVYIKNNSNLGFSRANNIGATKALGEYLLFLNSDMEILDSKLTDMVKYLESHPDVGLIGPKFLNPDLSLQGSVFPPQTVFNAFKEYWLGQVYSYSKYSPITNHPTKVWSISGGAILISKNLFTQIKGWDERYFFYYEDMELCRQVRNLNKTIIYFPECRVIHRHGASGKSITDSNNQWRRLIPSAKLYFGALNYYLIFFVMWSSQKIIGKQKP